VIYGAHEYPPLEAEGAAALFLFGVSVVSSAGCRVETVAVGRYPYFVHSGHPFFCEKLEIHHTPKHGSWLNMAEIELSVLARQCLDRRIPERESRAGEVGAWEAERNAAERSIDWRFTTEEARIKLKHLYPEIVEEPSYGPNLS
jgi:hypothetical protein